MLESVVWWMETMFPFTSDGSKVMYSVLSIKFPRSVLSFYRWAKQRHTIGRPSPVTGETKDKRYFHFSLSWRETIERQAAASQPAHRIKREKTRKRQRWVVLYMPALWADWPLMCLDRSISLLCSLSWTLQPNLRSVSLQKRELDPFTTQPLICSITAFWIYHEELDLFIVEWKVSRPMKAYRRFLSLPGLKQWPNRIW